MFISFEIILLCREFKQYLLNRSIYAVFIFKRFFEEEIFIVFTRGLLFIGVRLV